MDTQELNEYYEEKLKIFQELKEKKKNILKSYDYDGITETEMKEMLNSYKSRYVEVKKEVVDIIKSHIDLILDDVNLKSKFTYLQNIKL